MRNLVLCFVALGLLTGCNKPSQTQSSAASTTASISPADISFGPSGDRINPFPEAVEARLYMNNDGIIVSEQGKVADKSYPADGILLTAQEMHKVQNALYFVPAPEVVAACCIPRHAFLFYDKSHRYIGSISVCFECGCANVDGESINIPSDRDVGWDEIAIARVIEAHSQSTTPGK